MDSGSGVLLGASAYREKGTGYFSGARRDYVGRLPCDKSSAILEIGCGAGETGELALREGKCREYCAIELVASAAETASRRLTQVVCGDVEQVDLPWSKCHFDALIMSEVLEHLIDPWGCLRKLHGVLKPGARVFASSPNVSHYGVIAMLLGGGWNLEDVGVMDRTHLRWFTPRTYREMFESAGYRVDKIGPVAKLGRKASGASTLLPRAFHHLLWRQISIEATRE